jgi:general secretion pathway protein D
MFISRFILSLFLVSLHAAAQEGVFIDDNTTEQEGVFIGADEEISVGQESRQQRKDTTKEEGITLNLNEADIRAFISTVSEVTGKNFIIDPRVKGRVTVVFATPTSPDSVYDIFLSVLRVHGFSAVPSGDAIKIVPDAGAKQEGIPTVLTEESPSGDNLMTRVVQVNHADATQLSTILRPLLPQHAHIAAHSSSNTLVITDTANNVNRMVDIIHRIDQANNFGVSIIKLKHARAETLVNTLKDLAKSTPAASKDPGQMQSITAEERTNSLILYGDPSWRTHIKDTIAQLDRPIENEGNTTVIYLKYAKAKTLAGVLRGVGDKILKSDQVNNKKPGAVPMFDIQADESTNALVLTAPPNLTASLQKVIDKLDIRREQVHIEAIIVELRDDKTVELGVSWQTSMSDRDAFAASQPSGSLSASFPGTIGSGLSLGYIAGGNIRAILKALVSDGDTNILSTPSLVTLDNEEASIHVGQNVPFVTGQYTNNDSNAGNNPFQTIERHDVGIKLNVTPHINEGKTIELKIDQEVSSVDKDSTIEGITTNKRTINTTVLVDDGEVVVLGGLIDNSLSETASKVPLLGDIPVLGHLFRSKSTEYEKKNLMVFLRPRILRNEIANRQLADEEYMRIRGQQQQTWKYGIKHMPGETPPLLPDVQPSIQPVLQQEDAAVPAPVVEIDLSTYE